MNILRKLFIPDPWSQCQEPTPEARVARWYRAQGEHKAQEALRKAQIERRVDAYASNKVQPIVRPKLPKG